MTPSKLGNPRPREQVSPYEDTRFRVKTHRYLDVPDSLPAVDLWATIEGRTSRRGLGLIDEERVGVLLWLTAKTRATRTDGDGFVWQHRPVASAGGRHPIDILIVRDPKHPTVTLYDPGAHALCDLEVASVDALQAVVEDVNEITMNSRGAILLFAATFERTLSRYSDGESLIWRDSGALLTHCYLVAEGLNVGCCGIGVTGEPWVSSILGNPPGVGGVGGCVIGTIP